MEKRRSVSMAALLWRYLILAGTSVAALVAAWWLALVILINAGFVLPASAQSEHAAAAAAAMYLHGSFDAALADDLCHYVWFAPDGTVLETNLSGRRLEDAQRARQGETSPNLLGGAWTYQRVDFSDGTECLFQFDYSVLYGNRALRGVLPDFQIIWFSLLFVMLAADIVLITRHYTRRLRRAADRLAAASARIADGQLEGGDFSAAGVRELDGAMDAMRMLKETLSGSLRTQWRMEQQRAEQMAALAHDLKTPLTIIGGNAELLCEEPLAPAQRACAEAIERNTRYAQEYLVSLRALAAGTPGQAGDAARPPDEADAPRMAAAPLAPLLAEVRAQGEALCTARGSTFVLQAGAEGVVRMCRGDVLRALVNLVENAARYTPAGGQVMLTCREQQGWAVFSVADTGPGFSPEALARGTQPLYTGEKSRPQDGHMGLGLAFAAGAAKRHGGTLALANAPGGGAVVTLCLPAAQG